MLACILCIGGLEAAALLSVAAIIGHIICWIKVKIHKHRADCSCHCHAQEPTVNKETNPK